MARSSRAASVLSGGSRPAMRSTCSGDSSSASATPRQNSRPGFERSPITFETVPPTADQLAARIRASLLTHDWLVAEDDDGQVVGYAYGGQYKERAAYAWACEVSVYLKMGLRRTGLGRALYEALFERLVALGYLTAVAGMTLPNPASEGLHGSLGFELVGTYRNIGHHLL